MEHGIIQGDELPFLFRFRGFLEDRFFGLLSQKESELSQKFVRMFVNFAKVSNPTPIQGNHDVRKNH